MPLIQLDGLPRNTTKGTILRLLIQVGGIDKKRIGQIELQGRRATVEVPDSWADRLAAALDGASLAGKPVRAWRLLPREGREEDHFDRLMRLLKIESQAEAEQATESLRRMSPEEAERSGCSLLDLIVRDEASGLGGRHLCTLAKSATEQPLPWTRLNVGVPVLLSEQETARPDRWRGVVSEKTSGTIQIALDLYPETEASRFRLDLSNDEVATRRQHQALLRAQGAQRNRLAELRGVLLGERAPLFAAPLPRVTPLDVSLNASQNNAVQWALGAEHLAVIHGPPGTGKTTTLVELIRQSVAAGQRALACAPSNLAVDNLFERLLAAEVNAVRIGHPARVSESLRRRTLDLLVESHPDSRLARSLVKEAQALFRRASRRTRAAPAPGARQALRDEAKQRIADARRIEAQVVNEILDQAQVLCATTTALDDDLLGAREYEVAVIDEACQSTEPGAWIPLLRAQRVVLAGDHCQLPPTVVSQQAQRDGFMISMLERVMTMTKGKIARRLDVQYRMHAAIMGFSSEQFYEGTLQADASVAEHLLCHLPDVLRDPLTESPLLFVDTAGAGYDESREPGGESRRNEQEAALAAAKVRQLMECGVSPESIALISPYAAQVRLLRQLMSEVPALEIDSVDGFQGREKEALVVTLVRSNERQEIGFLSDIRRMNVALTRARRKLVLIGDSATIGGHPFYQQLLAYFEQQGAYRSVWEE